MAEQKLNSRGNPTVVNRRSKSDTDAIKHSEKRSQEYEKLGDLRTAKAFSKEAASILKDEGYKRKLREEKAIDDENVVSITHYNTLSKADQMLFNMKDKNGVLNIFRNYDEQAAGFMYWVPKE